MAPDVEAWFQQDSYQGNPHMVAQWADLHNSLAQAWVKADPANGAYVDDWAKSTLTRWPSSSRTIPAPRKPKAADLAVVFFKDFSEKYPGKFPSRHDTITGRTASRRRPSSRSAKARTSSRSSS